MTFLSVNGAVPDAIRQLRQSLWVSGLAGAVASCFSPEEGFAGPSFTCLGSNPRDAVTAGELLAVSLLDIAWRPEAVGICWTPALRLCRALLSAIRSDIDLWRHPMRTRRRWTCCGMACSEENPRRRRHRVQLLARKRPRLCPVSDGWSVQAVGVPVNTREALRTFLQDPTARAEIEALRPPSAAVVRLLRILDVAIWIRHSHARPPAESAGRTPSPSPGTAVRNTGYGRVFC